MIEALIIAASTALLVGANYLGWRSGVRHGTAQVLRDLCSHGTLSQQQLDQTLDRWARM